MARYNTVISNSSASSAATVASPASGALVKFTGTTYSVAIGDPVLYAGQSQSFYNGASGVVTLTFTTSGGGVFIGPGSSGTTSQPMPNGSAATIKSDGVNWVTFFDGGGPISASTGTFTGAISGVTTLSASGQVSTTSTSGFNLVSSSTDDSTSATTGAITVAGGVAINKNLSIGNVGAVGKLRILGSSSGTVTFQASATTTGGTYTLPAADATTSGYALVSNASGTLSWSAVGPTVATTTTNATFYPVITSSTSGYMTTANVPNSGFTFNPSTVTLTATNVSCTSLTEISSIAFKENVTPLGASVLDLVLQLTGVTYDRKDGTQKNEPGLIAEDVYEILPDLVQLKDGKPFGIHYTKLGAYLIESIKALQAEIDVLKGTKSTKSKKKGN